MNAPKKIWFDKDYLTVGFQAVDDRDIPYIRADIVDELVEAAKVVTKVLFNGKTSRDKADFWLLKDALAKLEENHE